jgi:hypothetical protein
MRVLYIGITDFAEREQIVRMSRHIRDFRAIGLPHVLMVGVMISYKTLKDIPSDWTPIWVPKSEADGLFLDLDNVFNAFHYADYEGVTDVEDLCSVALYGGPNMHALQLDMIWPEPQLVSEFRGRFPHIQVVLQVGAQALAQIGDDPAELVSRLKQYGATIDHVLLDKSMGRGKGMDAQVLLPFVQAIADSDLNVGLAVAGGLGPSSLHLVEPLIEKFPDISIDAQGQLRPSGDSHDPIDWTMAAEYLTGAIDMYSRIRGTQGR